MTPKRHLASGAGQTKLAEAIKRLFLAISVPGPTVEVLQADIELMLCAWEYAGQELRALRAEKA